MERRGELLSEALALLDATPDCDLPWFYLLLLLVTASRHDFSPN
jgi:hypothetical protein